MRLLQPGEAVRTRGSRTRIIETLDAPELSFTGSSPASLGSTEVFRNLDFRSMEDIATEIEWVSLEPGEVLMRQGEAGDALCVVLSGRLGAFVSHIGGVDERVGEIVRGETVGDMAGFADERRSATVTALRHTLLAKLSRSSFDKLRKHHHEVVMSIAQMFGRRLRNSNQGNLKEEKSASIALLAATPAVPLRDLGERIAAAL